MKTILFALSLMFVAAQQPIPMPPPGNPNHEEPAPGARCLHEGTHGVTAAQACACHAECMENRDGNGEPNGTFTRAEDNARCRSACHKDHCGCLSDCETS